MFLLAVVKVHCRFKDCYKYDMGLSNFSWAFMVTHTHTYTNIYTDFFSISRYKKIAGRKNPPLSRSPCYTPHCLFFYFFFQWLFGAVLYMYWQIFSLIIMASLICAWVFRYWPSYLRASFWHFTAKSPPEKQRLTQHLDLTPPTLYFTSQPNLFICIFFLLLIIIIIIFLRLDLGSKLRLRRKIGRRKKLFLKNTISLATVSVYLFFLWTGDNFLGRISLYYFNASIQCTITHSSS